MGTEHIGGLFWTELLASWREFRFLCTETEQSSFSLPSMQIWQSVNPKNRSDGLYDHETADLRQTDGSHPRKIMSSKRSHDFIFKILLLGPFAVGKTCMVIRYISNRFSEDHQATIGTNIYVKTIADLEAKDEKRIVSLQLWDLGGHIRRTQHMSQVFYRGASGAFIVYDITRLDTFLEIPLWHEQLMQWSPNAYTILVGNKRDLEGQRQVSLEQGRQLSDEMKCLNFFETSAKTGYQIEEAFRTFARLLVGSPPPVKW